MTSERQATRMRKIPPCAVSSESPPQSSTTQVAAMLADVIGGVLAEFQENCGHDLKARTENSARFWTAAALCRCSTACLPTQSGRGLPQSKTPAHGSVTQTIRVVTDFFKLLSRCTAAGVRRMENLRQHRKHGCIVIKQIFSNPRPT